MAVLAIVSFIFIIKLIKGAIRMAFILAIAALALWYASRFL